jgi:hypothetical protein
MLGLNPKKCGTGKASAADSSLGLLSGMMFENVAINFGLDWSKNKANLIQCANSPWSVWSNHPFEESCIFLRRSLVHRRGHNGTSQQPESLSLRVFEGYQCIPGSFGFEGAATSV